MRAVPVARRTIFAERRRATLAVGGVAISLVLVLVLGGVLAGATHQVTSYLRTSGADVIVSQRSVRTMHMSSSTLPPSDVDRVRAVPGVAWVAPIRYTAGMVGSAKDNVLAYVVGYDRGERGGPHVIVSGQAPGDREAVIDRVAARLLGVAVGDRVRLLGTTFRVAGLTAGTTTFTNTVVFITSRDFTRLRGPSISYIFVGASPGVSAGSLRDRLAAALPDTTVQTRNGFVRQEASLVRDMSADLMRIMTIVALVIALAVIALLLFTTTLAHLRDYGVLAALGATPARLVRTVLAQAMWAVALAIAAAVILAVAVGALVGRLSDSIEIIIEARTVATVAVEALVIAAVGALLPVRRITRLDPALAFRRTT